MKMFFENFCRNIFSGVYRETGDYTQIPEESFIILVISGVSEFEIANIHLKNQQMPFLAFSFPQEKLRFNYPRQRENWVVRYSSDFIVPDYANNAIKIFLDREKRRFISLPRVIPLDANDAIELREEMNKIYNCNVKPTASGEFRCFLGLCSILSFVLDKYGEQISMTAAGEFKRLIDDVSYMHLSLNEISKRCGYSGDHLRALFKSQYGISPQQYRLKRKMALAMELITTTNLSVKEIAGRCGFEHLSHFSTLFRKNYAMSPKEAVERFRFGTLASTKW